MPGVVHFVGLRFAAGFLATIALLAPIASVRAQQVSVQDRAQLLRSPTTPATDPYSEENGVVNGRAAAVLRELWNWRDKEAQAADRPAFHILQNHLLIRAAEQFAAGELPDYRHFSARRRQTFREAAERGLQLPEAEWPVRPKRGGTRPTREMERAAEALRRRRDAVADAHGLEPSLIAPRGALDALAADESRTETLLVPWQRDLLEL